MFYHCVTLAPSKLKPFFHMSYNTLQNFTNFIITLVPSETVANLTITNLSSFPLVKKKTCVNVLTG